MNNNVIKLFIALSMSLSIKGYSQATMYDISKYKLPEMRRHSLDFNLDISGSGHSSFYDVPDTSDITYENSSGNSSISCLFNYSFYNNSIHWQNEASSALKLGINTFTYNDSTIERYYAIDFLVDATNKYYFSPKMFLGIDVYSDFQYYKNYSELISNTNFLPLKFGVGRIEQVQDARQAIYLFDKLAKQNRVRADVGDDDVRKFAEFISILKNKRFFDSRIRKAYEIEAVDSFLSTNNYTLKQDARYFTTMTDFWDYGDIPVRKSGTRLSLAGYPGYKFEKNDNGYRDSIEWKATEENDLFLFGGLEFTYEKPLNLRWQTSLDAYSYDG